MGRTILTHVGTSVLECKALKEAGTNIDPMIQRAVGLLKQGRNPEQSIAELCNIFETGLEKYWEEEGDGHTRRNNVSGEIASLSLLNLQPDDKVLLIQSDTPKGRLSAHLLKKFLTLNPGRDYPQCNARVALIAGLKVPEESQMVLAEADRDAFIRKGLRSYVDMVWNEYRLATDHVTDNPDTSWEIIFNITGGYKGMIPIARDMSLLLANDAINRTRRPVRSDLCYLFETSDQPIWYGSFPVAVDWNSIPIGLLDRALGPDNDPPSERDVAGVEQFFERVSRDSDTMTASPLGAILYRLRFLTRNA